ncbi:hypothetical protein DDB_G0277161 [Dictyostelium discoideum AX4]|uniref:Putative uncharacterized protein DDB_G0277161 n=1 Tax=Dictyostelium discoideum TaxID=44689 RepID=Y9172_DICDI|nr:hypothetical protein DDB_G0277161 [Dictyostelium discoideum AX4]Q76P00.1 RecName: Full=Putative uncharacterized protein DDB_G0277161 [Dictyostelium discoideum]EAL68766.1 hypothetical protein DDB_G0277161 [Dictyostelium discoideum AX4]|eukprot:XP_642794.1 hypothetical protein DDB_G0277161 [Dictyostelium discoideum AX4]
MNNIDKIEKDIMYMNPIDSKFFFKPTVINDNNNNNNINNINNINNNYTKINNYNNLINTNINNKNNSNSNSVFSQPDQAATITNISNPCTLASPTPSSPSNNKLLMIQRDDMEKDINDYSNLNFDPHQMSKPSYHHHSHSHSHHSHSHSHSQNSHYLNNLQLQNLQNFQQQHQQKPISPPPSSLNIVVNRNRFFENSDPNFSYFSHNESNISDFFYNYVHYDHNFNFNENSFIFNTNNNNNNNNEINNSVIGNDILQTVPPSPTPTPPPPPQQQQFTQIKNTNYIFVPQQLKQ